jgi:hypothetical protein
LELEIWQKTWTAMSSSIMIWRCHHAIKMMLYQCLASSFLMSYLSSLMTKKCHSDKSKSICRSDKSFPLLVVSWFSKLLNVDYLYWNQHRMVPLMHQ